MTTPQPQRPAQNDTKSQGYKLLSLRDASFQNLIKQLPASLPADWDQSDQSQQRLILLLAGSMLVVRVTDAQWITSMTASDSTYRSEFVGSQYQLRLEQMVMFMYHCMGRKDFATTEVFRVWKELKVALLLWALSYRDQGMIEHYHLIHPVACIGEPVALPSVSISVKEITGHLCRWVSGKDGEWQGDISVNGDMQSIKFDRTPSRSPEYLSFKGEIGCLH